MQKNATILVSGANSGLGKHCCEYYNATPFTRTTSIEQIEEQAARQPFDAIIHAAFNPRPNIASHDLSDYLNDTLLLTQKLIAIPHKKFIFISSTDVYPKNDIEHTEDEVIHLGEVDNIYGITKLMSEALVQQFSKDALILRPSALLGKYARLNSVMKLLTMENVELTLSEESSFNYILHEDVTDFINLALMKNLTGIYNLAASSNVVLKDIASQFQRKVKFGKYIYKTGCINGKKMANLLKKHNSSLQNVELFLSNKD